MRRGWADFLGEADTVGHAVEIYSDLDELTESVATHLSTGFSAGGAALVVARPAHTMRFRETLAAAGWDVPALERDGRLLVTDAAETLEAIMDGGAPSEARFEQIVGTLLDRAATNGSGVVRVFGEMVDLLMESGRPEAALALESLWNDSAETRRFSLLCAYQLDVFDPGAQVGSLPQVCAAHSHVLPAHDADRLARAVDLALVDVLGETEAANVQLLVGTQIYEDRMPTSQLVLMWISDKMPGLAERVLASARSHYDTPAAAA